MEAWDAEADMLILAYWIILPFGSAFCHAQLVEYKNSWISTNTDSMSHHLSQIKDHHIFFIPIYSISKSSTWRLKTFIFLKLRHLEGMGGRIYMLIPLTWTHRSAGMNKRRKWWQRKPHIMTHPRHRWRLSASNLFVSCFSCKAMGQTWLITKQYTM